MPRTRLISGNRSHVNAANIPEDILAQVFSKLSNQSPGLEVGWDWVCVMEVCRRWCAVAKGTPSLWSYLHTLIFDSTRRLNQHLLLSKESDLKIEFAVVDREGNRVGNLIAALREIRRIRRIMVEVLVIIYQDEFAEISSYLNKPAPRLEDISFAMANVHRRQPYPFPITSPGFLKKVSLSYMNLSLVMPRLSGLTSLYLCYCVSFPQQELFGALERSPGLQSLTLTRCDGSPSSISKPVHLPNLSRLSLDFKQFADCYDFLTNIEAPGVLRWSVNCEKKLTSDDVPKLDIFSKLLKAEYKVDCFEISTARLHSRAPPKIQFRATNESGPEWIEAYIYLLFDPVDFDSVILRLLGIFRRHLEDADRIEIDNPDDSVAVETWQSVFCASVSAHSIHARVDIRGDNETNCIKALCMHPIPNAGVIKREVPCPKLKNIKLQWYDRGSDVDQLLVALVDTMRSRAEHGYAVHELTVISYFNIQEEDERLKALSQWVREVKWTKSEY